MHIKLLVFLCLFLSIILIALVFITKADKGYEKKIRKVVFSYVRWNMDDVINVLV